MYWYLTHKVNRLLAYSFNGYKTLAAGELCVLFHRITETKEIMLVCQKVTPPPKKKKKKKKKLTLKNTSESSH